MRGLIGFFLALTLVYFGVITPEGLEQAVEKIPGKGLHLS